MIYFPQVIDPHNNRSAWQIFERVRVLRSILPARGYAAAVPDRYLALEVLRSPN